jgi:hypothetical protein
MRSPISFASEANSARAIAASTSGAQREQRSGLLSPTFLRYHRDRLRWNIAKRVRDLDPTMFCANHSIPHEGCPNCQTLVRTMRPTVFAELAAAELRSGTVCCAGCNFVYFDVSDECPQCGDLHPFHVEPRRDTSQGTLMTHFGGQQIADLSALTLRDLAASGVSS